MPIHDPLHESANEEVIRLFQLERLQATINRVHRHVAFYRRHFDEAGVSSDKIETVDDVRCLPFTDRNVLVENCPYGLFAVPLRDIVRLQVASSGPTGEIVVGHTENDIEHWTELAARALACAGATKEDVVLILLDYDLCSGALGLHAGAEHIGATVIPGSSLAMDRQIEVLRTYRVTVLVAEPSRAHQLGDILREKGRPEDTVTLRRVMITGESWGPSLRPEIQELLGARTLYSYGIPEILSQGIAHECEELAGLHVNEDHFLVEIIDPVTREPVSDGGRGELVITTLTREGFPLIRYRTGDLTSVSRDRCACGRTFLRLAPISARCDDLISVCGARFYPDQIGHILEEAGFGNLRYRLIVSHISHQDHLEVQVGISNEVFQDEVRKVQSIHQQIQERFMEDLRIPVTVRLVEEGRFEKDAPLVEDRRWRTEPGLNEE